MKHCPRCGLDKPLSEFYFDKTKGKHRSYCKPCQRDYSRDWQRANPSAVQAAKRRYRESHPEEVAAAKLRRYHAKGEESRQRQRDRRAANPERFREYSENAKEKRNTLGLYPYYKYGLTPEARAALVEAQDNQCPLCQKSLDDVRQHVDHDHATGFIRGILCHGCNSRLGWYERQAENIAAYLAGPHVEPVTDRRSQRRSWS